MSSATSTERAEARAAGRDTIKPWQFFTLACLVCATAGTYLVRGKGSEAVVLQIVLMVATGLVAIAVLGTVRPLFGVRLEEAGPAGRRARAALEREKVLTLRAIKELEFDRAMGKLSDGDFAEMSGRLRARAGRLIRQLDQGSGYRDQIEKDLIAKIGGFVREETYAVAGASAALAATSAPAAVLGIQARTCAACASANDADARFCKSCGARL
jgi:hypothetical protein